MGTVIGNAIGIPFGSSSRNWTPLTPLGGETPDFWVKENSRSGLTLTDSVNVANSPSILTPTFISSAADHYMTGDKTRVCERLFDGNSYTIYAKLKVGKDYTVGGNTGGNRAPIELGSWTGNRGITVWHGDNFLTFVVGDGVADTTFTYFFQDLVGYEAAWINTTLKNAGWCDFIITVNYTTKIVKGYIYNEAGVQIALTPDVNISAYSFGVTENSTSYKFYSDLFTICDFKKFTGIKTIAQCRDNTYVTDIQIDIPDTVTGIDVSGNSNHFTKFGVTRADRYYDTKNSHLLVNGFARYSVVGSDDIDLPYNRAAVEVIVTVLPTGYIKISDHAGAVAAHNLADSMLEFVTANWDRSNATIYAAAARAAGTYYDAAHPKRWHISELNQLLIQTWKNTGYKGIDFVKVSPNSVDIEERATLTEIFSYAAEVTGTNYQKVLQYTGDRLMLLSPYLLDPFNDVLKVTAIEDSVFRLNVNKAILYTKAELFAEIDAVPKINADEDEATRIFNWLLQHCHPAGAYWGNNNEATTAEQLANMNSFPDGWCGFNAGLVNNVMEHYYPNENTEWDCTGGHRTTRGTRYYLEGYMKLCLYKGRYIPTTFAECLADRKLFTEPLRKVFNEGLYSYSTDYYLDFLNDAAESTVVEKMLGVIDNLVMKLPKDASFVFPVKSANVPDFYARLENTCYANLIATAPAGVIGNVEMPFALLLITGAGTIKVGSTTYTLPADEATVRALFQDGSSGTGFVNKFEILTNTGGIVAEFLINRQRIWVERNNTITEGIISGSIKVEATPTLTPVVTSVISVDKGTADAWTLLFNKWFTRSKSFRHPMVLDSSLTYKRITFAKSGGAVPRPIWFFNQALTDVNVIKTITAGAAVVDQCFASKLTPNDSTFAIGESIVFTFTSFDGSDCYYTLDGSTPSAAKTLYTAPFTVSSEKTIKWINIKAGYADSHINTRVITKLLGAELIDQSNWYKLAYWTMHNANWAQDGVKVVSDGNSGNLLYASFFTIGKQYRIVVTITKTSGQGFGVTDGVTYPIYGEVQGTLTGDFTAQAAELYLTSFTLIGTVTALSIKEILE